jgi:hypothetical protein
MSTYSKGDLERIAAAIGVHVDHVAYYVQYFEAAATWYRLDREGAKKRSAPAVIRSWINAGVGRAPELVHTIRTLGNEAAISCSVIATQCNQATSFRSLGRLRGSARRRARMRARLLSQRD